jgi:hypothetical protein
LLLNDSVAANARSTDENDLDSKFRFLGLAIVWLVGILMVLICSPSSVWIKKGISVSQILAQICCLVWCSCHRFRVVKVLLVKDREKFVYREMSSSANPSASPGSSSLRPAWHKGNQGGRGFQPPPSVDSRARSISLGSEPKRDVNKFSALQDDDNEVVVTAAAAVRSNNNATKNEENANSNKPPNSRSEAFRSSFRPPGGGRTLADLAARVPEAPGVTRSHSTGYAANNSGGRFSGLRSTDATATGGISEKVEAKIIRYTREKLLSMRPPPKPDAEPPADLVKAIDGSVILSKSPLDPGKLVFLHCDQRLQ